MLIRKCRKTVPARDPRARESLDRVLGSPFLTFSLRMRPKIISICLGRLARLLHVRSVRVSTRSRSDIYAALRRHESRANFTRSISPCLRWRKYSILDLFNSPRQCSPGATVYQSVKAFENLRRKLSGGSLRRIRNSEIREQLWLG